MKGLFFSPDPDGTQYNVNVLILLFTIGRPLGDNPLEIRDWLLCSSLENQSLLSSSTDASFAEGLIPTGQQGFGVQGGHQGATPVRSAEKQE